MQNPRHKIRLVKSEMTGWPYGYLTTYHTTGTMGLLVFLGAIALVIIDHALEGTLARHYL